MSRKPKPPVDKPRHPRLRPHPPELSADAAKEWRRVGRLLRERGMLSELDRGLFAAYCQAYGRWAQAERALSEMAKRDPVAGALLVKTANGAPIPNPLVAIAHRAMADMARYAAELGMAPAARARRASATAPRLGKKERQALAAQTAEIGTDWERLLRLN
jgi:P27 family predicted phage terminase small subunit